MSAILSLKPSLSAGPFLKISNNLSDVASVATSRTNLGLVAGGSGDIWVEKAGDTMGGSLVIQGTLTIASELQHEGDTDTKIGFGTDQQTFTVGGVIGLRVTNTTQDLVEIGDVAGGGDWDINFNNGSMFFEGSTGRLGVGIITPGSVGGGTSVNVNAIGDTFPAFVMSRTNGVSYANRQWGFGLSTDGTYFIQDTTAGRNRILIDTSGLIAIGPGHAPEGSLHGYTDDNDVGWMWSSASGVNATPTTIKANDTRDVIRILSYESIVWDGAASEYNTGSLTPGNEAEIYNDATDIFKLRVNAGGDIDVRRTAGAATATMGLKLMWI